MEIIFINNNRENVLIFIRYNVYNYQNNKYIYINIYQLKK